MAEIVKLTKSDVSAIAKAKADRNGGQVYPWKEWFDGQARILREGDRDDNNKLIPGGDPRDFLQPSAYMPAKFKTAARAHYKVLEVLSTVLPDGTKLKNAYLLKARDMNPQERTAEDAQRVIDRAAAKMKRDAKKTASKPATQVVPPVPPAHS